MNFVQMLMKAPVPESVMNPFPIEELPKKKKHVDNRPRVNSMSVKDRYRAAMLGREPITARELAVEMKLSKTHETLRNLDRKYGCVMVVGYVKGANHKKIELWQWTGD
jgi:hypothetical protein